MRTRKNHNDAALKTTKPYNHKTYFLKHLSLKLMGKGMIAELL
jgi:hypothetical protein